MIHFGQIFITLFIINIYLKQFLIFVLINSFLWCELFLAALVSNWLVRTRPFDWSWGDYLFNSLDIRLVLGQSWWSHPWWCLLHPWLWWCLIDSRWLLSFFIFFDCEDIPSTWLSIHWLHRLIHMFNWIFLWKAKLLNLNYNYYNWFALKFIILF